MLKQDSLDRKFSCQSSQLQLCWTLWVSRLVQITDKSCRQTTGSVTSASQYCVELKVNVIIVWWLRKWTVHVWTHPRRIGALVPSDWILRWFGPHRATFSLQRECECVRGPRWKTACSAHLLLKNSRKKPQQQWITSSGSLWCKTSFELYTLEGRQRISFHWAFCLLQNHSAVKSATVELKSSTASTNFSIKCNTLFTLVMSPAPYILHYIPASI